MVDFDYPSLADQVDAEQAEAARQTVRRYVSDPDEQVEVLDMLGLAR